MIQKQNVQEGGHLVWKKRDLILEQIFHGS